VLRAPWIQEGLEQKACATPPSTWCREHYQEIAARRERQADKILAAVQERLVKEINYSPGGPIKLEMDVEAGKQPRMQPEHEAHAAEELTARLEQRRSELTRAMKPWSPAPRWCSAAR
jgi:hypothetical protein